MSTETKNADEPKSIEQKISELERPYKSAEVLEYLHWDQGLTHEEMGQRLNCSASCVGRHLHKNDVGSRGVGHAGRPRKERASYFINPEGYQLWTACVDGKTVGVYVHQLTACLDHPPEEVFSDDTHCHHRAVDSAITWSGMLDVVSRSAHEKTHHENVWTQEDGIPVLVTQSDDGEE